MLSLFSTSSDKAGYRLQYMEIFNWGTFNERVFRIHPQGNNSLLTGANASGKSTYVDALLTLMVPIKRDRFYNQSSGVEKKGDRTEETYVYGHYGNIQKEGELSTTTQTLRDKNTYSVLLANFSNTEQKIITIFQVRWFSNGEMKRTFGVAHVPLEIQKDFSSFDSKGNWRKRLEKNFNTGIKKKIEFLNGPSAYAERICHLFGMRSEKALNLFNHIVGVKVLDDLNEFIRTNMLEELDAENEFIQLKESFITLMDAKTNIEKAGEQIRQLEPICEHAKNIDSYSNELKKQIDLKESSVYWFAKQSTILGQKESEKENQQLDNLNDELSNLKEKQEELKDQESKLRVQIEKDEVGNQIRELEKEIRRLSSSRDNRTTKLDEYNKLAKTGELVLNPNEDLFIKNREDAQLKRNECEQRQKEQFEKKRLAKNREEDLTTQIEQKVGDIQVLRKNKNNISGRVAEIREEILEHVGANKDEIPFIGELVKVKEAESKWELAIEKILHNFALNLIVPEKYYKKVNEYVNSTNLRGRIVYQRYKEYTSLKDMISSQPLSNHVLSKLEFKQKNKYTDWIEDVIKEQFNFACVENLEEFSRYEENAVTKEGLIKFKKGKHEKDDRRHILSKENYVLGWDNTEKIKLLREELIKLQEEQKEIVKKLREIDTESQKLGNLRDCYSEIFSNFKKFDDIDWESFAIEIAEKEEAKKRLEATNDKVKELQGQLSVVQNNLKKLEDVEIQGKLNQIFVLKESIKKIEEAINDNQLLINNLGEVDCTLFEKENPELLTIEFSQIETERNYFIDKNQKLIQEFRGKKSIEENEVRDKISAFKRPSEEILLKYKDWRSDVNSLPESGHLEFISEYQRYLDRLKADDLPRFEKKFNAYLQETIINKVGDFRMFFINWSDSIKDNIKLLNESLKEIDFKDADFKTYIQIIARKKTDDDIKLFENLLSKAIPNFTELETTIDGRKNHFYNHIEPLISKLDDEKWRLKVMEVRTWFDYKAEEFYKSDDKKFGTYENMGQLSGGEKAQLTYTILGSAIAYQFGLTKEGLQPDSFRFIAIDEAFKSQDEDKARYLIKLCKQLHLQLLVVTPSDNIQIVENDISFVHFVERKEGRESWLYDMPIEQFKEEKERFLNND